MLWIKNNWGKLAACITFLAALFTVIVRADTIRGWFFPKPDEVRVENTIVGCVGGPFRFPSTYSKADEKFQQFFQRSQGFALVSIHNVHDLDVFDVTVTLSIDSQIEVIGKDNIARAYGPSTTFPIGTVAKGESVTALIWTSRPFAASDSIIYSSRYGSHHFKASELGNPDDLEFFKTGYYILLAVTLALTLILFIIMIWMVARKNPPKPKRTYQRKSKTLTEPNNGPSSIEPNKEEGTKT